MLNSASRTYLENKILTATAEQLQLMLYEGAIRFSHVARSALEERNFEKAQDAFERADAILIELHSGLRPERDPDLCEKYALLYSFCARRLLEGNLRHDVALVDDALLILNSLRETWVLVLEKLAQERAASYQAAPAGASFSAST